MIQKADFNFTFAPVLIGLKARLKILYPTQLPAGELADIKNTKILHGFECGKQFNTDTSTSAEL